MQLPQGPLARRIINVTPFFFFMDVKYTLSYSCCIFYTRMLLNAAKHLYVRYMLYCVARAMSGKLAVKKIDSDELSELYLKKKKFTRRVETENEVDSQL